MTHFRVFSSFFLPLFSLTIFSQHHYFLWEIEVNLHWVFDFPVISASGYCSEMMSVTCHNLDLGRTVLDLVACGCSSSALFERYYSARNYTKVNTSKGISRGYGVRNLVKTTRCQASSMTTAEPLLNGKPSIFFLLFWYIYINIYVYFCLKTIQVVLKVLQECWTWKSQKGLFPHQICLKLLLMTFWLWTGIFSRWVVPFVKTEAQIWRVFIL